jgi:pSer/pThr/pTyr-binding forkhead associated (FHA) protein
VERLAALLNLLITIGRYFFLFLLYRFLWQLLKVTSGLLDAEGDGLVLVVTDLSEPSESHSYKLITQLTVGRSSSNDICLNDPYCSDRHLRLWRKGEKVFVEELDTSFGTLVAGTPLPKRTPVEIKPGTKIMIGTTQLSLQPEKERSAN